MTHDQFMQALIKLDQALCRLLLLGKEVNLPPSPDIALETIVGPDTASQGTNLLCFLLFVGILLAGITGGISVADGDKEGAWQCLVVALLLYIVWGIAIIIKKQDS